MALDINDLKKTVFYEMLNLAGRAFILIKHSDDVVIGRRGFLPEEKEKGLVLVLNKKMNFQWDKDAISIRLVFGTIPEDCHIPVHSIMSIFSPELSAQFSVAPKEKGQEGPSVVKLEKKTSGQKVVKVDFNKKK